MGALPRADMAMRPRLSDDVRFVESPDGVYVHSDYGACVLRGRQAYAWLSRLAPALTGEHTLAELTERLPGDKRDMVENLVRRLAEQRFVVDARRSRPHGLTEDERRVYAEEIAFIGYVLDSPEWRFERLRGSRLVLAGDGPLLTALLAACVGTGWRRISVAGPGPAAIGRTVEEARRDPAQEVRIVPGASLPDVIANDADVLLQVSTDIGALVRTARACEAAGIPAGQALVRPAEVWLSQVGRPSVTAVESGWHRLAALPAATPAASGENLLVGPLPEVVAAMPALACFSHLTGLDAVGAAPEPALTRVDLRNLDTFPHRFVPHPRVVTRRARGPEAARALAESLASAAAVGAGELPDRAAEAIDSRLGLIGALDEEGLAQTPLPVCQATVSDPLGALPRWAPPPQIVGWGEDRRTARLRCLLAALATYGVLAAADTDGPHTADRDAMSRDAMGWDGGGQDGGNEDVPGQGGGNENVPRRDAEREDVAGRDARGGDVGGQGVVWGVELPEGRPRAVPVAALRLTGTGMLRAPEGTGAGLTWPEALAAGLRAHVESLLVARLTGGTAGTPGAPSDLTTDFVAGPAADPPAGLLSDPVAGALARRLRLAGVPLDVRDCTSILGVPAHAFTVPGGAVLVSAAATAQAALRDGLERLLLAWQSRAERQSAYSAARPLWAPSGDPEEAVRVMTRALRAAGRVPVAVPLDGDPEASRLLPFVTQVVLLDD
ncbi:YcaO-like family protein [Sphaerisporangium sp. NPDC005288]|uniref:YcaO-like family protein n=1 Tax=Sphaerisporangium sp. NPDC005288 TaxID=3155114 RepID=UPI0033AA5A2C